jgi:hypothetical protein
MSFPQTNGEAQAVRGPDRVWGRKFADAPACKRERSSETDFKGLIWGGDRPKFGTPEQGGDYRDRINGTVPKESAKRVEMAGFA